MPIENFEQEGLEKIPDLRIPQWIFQYKISKPTEQTKLKENIMKCIEENQMAPFYTEVSKDLKWTVDESLLTKMKQENTKELKDLDKKIKEAEETLGDTEIRESMVNKAHYFSKIGDKAAALTQFRTIMDKTLMLGTRLDLTFHLIRIGFFFSDQDLITKNIEKANSLIEEGGDWDRRNRLKVYRGLYSLSIRNFSEAAEHFLEAVATFTSYELMDYQTFITYTVLIAMIALKRPELRKKVVKGSEILEVLHGLPEIREYLMSLYELRYQDFFRYLAGIEKLMQTDMYLSEHVRFYVREMRILAYTQHLESYSSLSLQTLASNFGVTMEFLDKELSRFIANGRLACKIDRVRDIVHTIRTDNINFQYQSAIKHGDILLNRIQKLSRVINI